MRAWTVAGGLIEDDGRLLLVQNRRRDGSLDWSTPGGVVDPGEGTVEALSREVEEETGLVVARWDGPLWTVDAEAPSMGWSLRVEVHRALEHTGDVVVDDPDGIVVDAAWFDIDGCVSCLAGAWRPAREPMLAWLEERWSEARAYRYRLDGTSRSDDTIVRLGE